MKKIVFVLALFGSITLFSACHKDHCPALDHAEVPAVEQNGTQQLS